MAFTDADKQAMDSAAVDAENDLSSIVQDEHFVTVARWWNKWYMKAGHRRLARILLQYVDKEG